MTTLPSTFRQCVFQSRLNQAVAVAGEPQVARERLHCCLNHPELWQQAGALEALLEAAGRLNEGTYAQLAHRAFSIALYGVVDGQTDQDVHRSLDALVLLLRDHGQDHWHSTSFGGHRGGHNAAHLLIVRLGNLLGGQQTPQSHWLLVERVRAAFEILVAHGLDLEEGLDASPEHVGRARFADALDLAGWYVQHQPQGGGLIALDALLCVGADERLVLRLPTTGPRTIQAIEQHPRLRAKALGAMARQQRCSTGETAP